MWLHAVLLLSSAVFAYTSTVDVLKADCGCTSEHSVENHGNPTTRTLTAWQFGTARGPSSLESGTTLSTLISKEPFSSQPNAKTITDADGNTLISNTNGILGILTGLTTPVTLTAENGVVTTFTPSQYATASTPKSSSRRRSASRAQSGQSERPYLTTINTLRQTVVSGEAGIFTIPSGLATPVVLTPKGQSGKPITFIPLNLASSESRVGPPASSQSSFTGGATTALNPLDPSDSSIQPPSVQPPSSSAPRATGTAPEVESPTSEKPPPPNDTATTTGRGTGTAPGLSVPTSKEAPTITGTASSTIGGFIILVTTSVIRPKATDDASVIPCNLWFFSSCLRWDDFNIFGWEIHLPPGNYPPIGPDRVPTFSSRPTGQCKTQSAQLCATRTSYGVSTSQKATVTTISRVVSTCATVFGCEVDDRDSSTTVTGSCTVSTTVTDVWVSCPTSASTSCKTTSTSLVSGCSVTPTTVTCGQLTPTGVAKGCEDDRRDFIVYPKDGTDGAAVKSLSQKLQSFVKAPSDIKSSDTKNLGLNYWRLPLAAGDLEAVANITEVGALWPDCANDCYDPPIAVVYQDSAPEHLKYVSWPQRSGRSGTPPALDHRVLQNKYFFDDSAGEGIPVYIVDTGANLEHPELQHLKSRTRWLHVGMDVDQAMTGQSPTDDSQTDPRGAWSGGAHGTSMLSLIAGKTLGVAKNVNPILVRIPRRAMFGGGISQENFLNGLSAVDDDLGPGQSTSTRAIVLLAINFPVDEFYRKTRSGDRAKGPDGKDILDLPTGWINRQHTILASLAAKGALVVTGTGNKGDVSKVDGWPATFGNSYHPQRLPTMIAAGCVTSDGTRAEYLFDDAGGLPHVYAPGVENWVADGNAVRWAANPEKTKRSTGTSDSAALTAGLTAYFVRMVQLGRLHNVDGTPVADTPQSIEDFIMSLSWSRQAAPHRYLPELRPRRGIWNGIDFETAGTVCEWDSRSLGDRRRQIGEKACSAPTSASVPLVTTFAPEASELPTLPPVGISTPPGSSCVSTAQVTECAPGSGGQSACVSNPTCVSWVATSTAPTQPTETTTTTTTSLEQRPVICHNEADFPGHGDISPGAESTFADTFCSDTARREFGPSDNLNGTSRDSGGISYFMAISWINGCATTVEKQDIQNPLGPEGPRCAQLLQNAFHDCNNGGVGGYIDAGCLRYEFIGGK